MNSNPLYSIVLTGLRTFGVDPNHAFETNTELLKYIKKMECAKLIFILVQKRKIRNL